ncbi:MAG: dienelactone hydrolase family protein [Alphaproteobacteria bacterium]
MSAPTAPRGRRAVDQRLIDLHDAYTHGDIDRRVFVDRLAALVGGVAAGLALIRLVAAEPAAAAMVAADDPRLETGMIPAAASGGVIATYVAKPKDAHELPAVVVIHENRGLNAHIQDVARRLALEGFLALAPDFLSPLGGTPEDQDKAREMIGELDGEATVANAVAVADAARGHADGNGKAGAVGFCWGGALANSLAIADPLLGAAVVYYGRQPDPQLVPTIKAPLLLHYAGLDERINAGVAPYEEALKANGKTYTIHVYEGVNHAFNNDTSSARYDEAAATLAWSRTVAFLKQYLA